jgi:hypothetical protein
MTAPQAPPDPSQNRILAALDDGEYRRFNSLTRASPSTRADAYEVSNAAGLRPGARVLQGDQGRVRAPLQGLGRAARVTYSIKDYCSLVMTSADLD